MDYLVSFNTALAGFTLFLAGVCGFIRHFLLEPKMAEYPKAPGWLLAVFFVFAGVLCGLGMRFIAGWWMGVTAAPPGADPALASLGAVLFIYKGSMLVNVMMQRYPAQVWKRLNQMYDVVRCSKRT